MNDWNLEESQDKHRFEAHHECMTDQPPESRPASESDSEATRVLPPDQEPPAPRQRLQDRLWSFRSVIAVALASVIVGGLGGAVLANVSQNDDERRFTPGQGRFDGRGDGQGPRRDRFDREGPPMPPPMMDERLRQRFEEWRRGMGQRQWDREGPFGLQPSDQPSPARPTPTG